MKKLGLFLAAISLAAVSACAQGLVIFTSATQSVSTNNVDNTDFSLGGAATGRITGAGNYYFALFYSTTQSQINGSAAAVAGGFAASQLLGGVAGWNFSGLYAASTATDGRWSSLNHDANGNSIVSGLAGGASAYFAIVGWSASFGTTVAQAASSVFNYNEGFIGQSAVSGLLTLGDGGIQISPVISGSLSPAIPAFTLGTNVQFIPEPGPMALAALGGAALWRFRRKQ